MDKVSVIGI